MAIRGHAEITAVAKTSGEFTARKKMLAARLGWNSMANDQAE
jgi:hypothetical protein